MFATVFAFELRYWLKRPLTLLFFVLFFLLAFSETAAPVGGDGPINRNAPVTLALAMAVLTAVGQIITTAIAGTAVLRDEQLGMQELLYTTPLSKGGYLLGRFAGAFVIMLVIYTALPLGLFLGTLMPWVPAERLGAHSLWNVIQPFLLIAVPNLFFVSALFFAVGALTRKLFAVYVTGIFLLLSWQITQRIVGHLDNLALGALLDPFALTTTSIVTRYWSVAEQNSLIVPAAGVMLRNRMLWIAAALGLFALVAVVFRLRLQTAGRTRSTSRAEAAPTAPATVPLVVLRYDALSWQRAFLSQAWFHFRSITREAPFRAIAAICLVNLVVNMWFLGHPQQSAMWPVTSAAAPRVANVVYIFIVLLATLYGGELIWRERQLKTDQIQDSLPAPLWVTYSGKLVAVFLAICAFVVVACAVGMVMQAVQGYTRFQPVLYAQVMMLSVFPTTLAVVALAMGVHALVNQKFVGHLIIITYLVSFAVLSSLGFNHSLYQVGAPPAFTYSDMNGWGPYLPRMLTINGYSIAFCLLIASVGYLLLVRGTGEGRRWRHVPARWRAGGAWATGLSAVATLAFGGVYFYNTNVLNRYFTTRATERRTAAWERKYKPLAALPLPRVVAVELRQDFFPERRAAAWHGTIKTVNRDSRAIDTLFVSLRPSIGDAGLSLDSLVFDREAALIHDDTPQGVRLYRLAKPLASGDSLTVRFAGRLEPRGFPDGNFNNDVAANGSFVNLGYVPGFGYGEGNELSDDDIRKRNGLPPKPRMKTIDDPAMRLTSYLSRDADWIAFDETTCTSPDQISVAPGYLQREWTENGRRCFHYVMDKPILDFYSTLSARYAVRREDHHGVNLEIYYLPEHAFALASMLQSAKDGLDYFGANFSPYQYRQFRVLEFPHYADFAQAFPNTIPYSEGIGFLYRKEDGDDKVDFAYFVTAHELAHQWWGHQLVGGDGQGSTMFSEGLAEYSALTVMEKRYGREAAQKFLRRELDEYLRGRGTENKKELPLLYVENQGYVHYSKGSLCFYALRDYIGEAAMNAALRAFLQKWAFKGPPYPNARDLLAEFNRVTPDSLKYVLKDLFEEITFYESKTDTATATQRPDGKYAVHLVLQSKKLKGDSLGNVHEVPVGDYIDVGIFGAHVAGQKLGSPLLVQKVRITQQVTTLDFVVDKEPRQAGIDPYNKLIDRTPEDNTASVTITRGGKAPTP